VLQRFHHLLVLALVWPEWLDHIVETPGAERGLKQAVDRDSPGADVPAIVDSLRVQPAGKKIGAIIEEPLGQSKIECRDSPGSRIFFGVEFCQLGTEGREVIIRGT
jgi:hypothetical protein